MRLSRTNELGAHCAAGMDSLDCGG
jgi:hypothetical protein